MIVRMVIAKALMIIGERIMMMMTFVRKTCQAIGDYGSYFMITIKLDVQPYLHHLYLFLELNNQKKVAIAPVSF